MANLVKCDNEKCNTTVQNHPYTLSGWFIAQRVNPMHHMGDDEDHQFIFCTATCLCQWLVDKHGLIVDAPAPSSDQKGLG
jgi:hypothetical protein